MDFLNFEAIGIKFSLNKSNFTIFNIYRPPSSNPTAFRLEFSSLLEDLVPSTSKIILTGDFNLHVNDLSQSSSSLFLSLLNSFNLTQHINFSTHKLGHTLDLLIARSTSNIISNIKDSIPNFCDHHAILFSIIVPSYPRPARVTKVIRCINKINIPSFCQDISNSEIYTSPPTTFSSYVELFSKTLSGLLDKHAQSKIITISERPHKPYITSEILEQKRIRSKLEII